MEDKLKIKIFSFTLDCKDPDKLADFYATFLGWDKGANKEEGWVWVTGPEKYPFILFQEDADYIPPVWPTEPGAQQTIAHLDFAVTDMEKAVPHAIRCGAIMAPEQFSDDWRVMFDPEGHPFCLAKKKTIFSI